MNQITSARTFGRPITLDCDVCVVGSGAGGATVAAELAEAGWDVIVLEEGPHKKTEDFNGNAAASVRDLYRDAGATVAYGKPPILYQEGRLVGGSSVINGGMSWKTPEAILARWEREHGLPGLAPDKLAPYFGRVEKRIHVREQSKESVGRDNELLKIGAERKGWDVIVNRRNQVHCHGSNNCAFGCPTGAKQSPLVTYIPRALSFGARIYSDVRASHILWQRKQVVGVEGHVVDPGQRKGNKVTVRARVVVSACGAIHTPALLFRSGYRSPSGALGKRLSLHPNIKVVAEFDEEVRGWEGVHQAYQVREFQKEGLVFAAVNIPPSLLSMTIPLFGHELEDLLLRYDRLMVAGLLCEDSSTGTVRMLPGGRPQAFYKLNDQDFERLIRGTRYLCDMLFAAGAKRIHSPLPGVGTLENGDDIKNITESRVRRAETELLTVHLMGTAGMGGDPARAVTDECGRVFDTHGLVIADASLFPTPIGVNPMETIQALATRNAHRMIHDKRRLLA